MKSLLALAALLVLVPAASFGKSLTLNGKNQVGGSLSYSNTTVGSASASALAVTPTFIHMFSDNFGLGLGLTYTKATAAGVDLAGTGMMPVMQYHFLVTDNASYYLQAAYNSNAAYVSGTPSYGSTFSCALGMNYFLNDNLSFGPALTYTTVMAPTPPTSSTISLVGAFTIWL